MGKLLLWLPALVVAFVIGAFSHSLVSTARAQDVSTQPQVVHLADVTGASLQSVAPGVKLKDVAHAPSGDVAVLEITSVPRHRHNHTDEIIYVINGTATATLAGKSYDLKTGDLVVLPHGIPHDFTSTNGVRLLGIAYPRDPSANDMELVPH